MEMKKFIGVCAITCLVFNVFLFYAQAQEEEDIAGAVKDYFYILFNSLKSVAEQEPNMKNFREIMKPVAESTDGFFGATLVDPDFVIRQVYKPTNFLARGFDLKKVKELKEFYKTMKESPSPQLSEPGHGSLFQPRLISMRYPIVKDGKLINIVSMMVRTKSFLKATNLDKCKGFRIICLGKLAKEKGNLSEDYEEITLELPSTEWIIQYER